MECSKWSYKRGGTAFEGMKISMIYLIVNLAVCGQLI
jgi:hypothetical protein